jgi:hypothetical protein
MAHDYRAVPAPPARRRPAAALPIALATLLVAAFALTACGSSSVPAPSVSEAYGSAHPVEGVPGRLQTVEMSREEVGRRIRHIVGTSARVVLPRCLPAGFEPAAPYISVGDGTARPNPEGWGRSYRVSYTDGRGLLVMTVGADRLPDGVSWSDRRLRVDGRPARAGRAGNATVVATAGGRPLIVITGRLVKPGSVLRSARSVVALP